MTVTEDTRKAALHRWLVDCCRQSVADLTPASEDASFRRYFRVRLADGSTRIAMDAPPAQEDSRPFVSIAGWFRQAGVQVPEVLAVDLRAGFLLLSDLGNEDYLSQLTRSPASAGKLYRDAVTSLVRLQSATATLEHLLPRYSKDLLQRELDLFPEWFCRIHLGIELAASEHHEWQRCCELLVASAKAQGQVVVHRDYHSRNLMVTEDDNPGVIDFQDAVIGPLSYDLVSLLKDCYIVWPDPDCERWVDGYLQQARASGIDVPDKARFLRDYNRMGIQRHLKVAGIFARLNHRDGKAGYLNDLPLVARYLRDALAQEPDLAFVAELLSEKCLPRMNR